MSTGILKTFIAAVYGHAFDHDFHPIVVGIRGEKPKAEIRTHRCVTMQEMVRAVEGFAGEKFNAYYPTALIRSDRQLVQGARGTEADADAIIGFHADIDLMGPAHPDATVTDVATALRIIDAFEVPPTFVIFTGHGVQAIWLFKEPLLIENEVQRRRAKLLVRRFVATIAAVARQMGGHVVDATGDLARVLRSPETMNYKVKDGVELPVEMARIIRPIGDLSDDLPRYNPEDIEPLLVQLDDVQDVDFSLVGQFALIGGAATPAIVERLCQRSADFMRLWRHDSAAPIHDHTTSGYRFAIIGYLVRGGATDQEIADAICAWYSAHSPEYDKHLHRPGLIATEIAKQRTRPKKLVQSKGASTESQRLDGPGGISLIPTSVSSTPKRWNAQFNVLVDGKDTEVELPANSTLAGQNTASDFLVRTVAALRPGAPLTKEQSADVRVWLSQILSPKKLTTIQADLGRQAKVREQTLGVAGAASIREIVRTYVQESLRPVFVDPDGCVWSESLGRAFTRAEFLAHVPAELVLRIQAASNYGVITADSTKPIYILSQWMKVVWSDLVRDLPDELHAHELAPDSKAAGRFREQIVRLWLTPETWMKFDALGTVPPHVARMSLASRIRETSFHASQRPAKWERVLKGVSAFYRVEQVQKGKPAIWLAMRADLCRHQIKGVCIDGVRTQAQLTALMTRYGLMDNGSVADRIRGDRQRSRLCVLSRPLCDYLIHDMDDDDESAGPSGDLPAGPGLEAPDGVDPVTGEVLATC